MTNEPTRKGTREPLTEHDSHTLRGADHLRVPSISINTEHMKADHLRWMATDLIACLHGRGGEAGDIYNCGDILRAALELCRTHMTQDELGRELHIVLRRPELARLQLEPEIRECMFDRDAKGAAQ